MYDLGPDLETEVEPGTNLLVTGPPLTGKRALCLDILAAGTEQKNGAIVVTTKDGAERVLSDYKKRTAYQGRPVAVVDCVTRQQGVNDVLDDERIKYTSSPVDMTVLESNSLNFSKRSTKIVGSKRTGSWCIHCQRC